jgi:hypothetical protein
MFAKLIKNIQLYLIVLFDNIPDAPPPAQIEYPL